MFRRFDLFVILIGGIICVTAAHRPLHYKTKRSSSGTPVFQPPENSDITQIAGTSTPWVNPDLIDKIINFKNNLLEDLQTFPTIKGIWDVTSDSDTTRAVVFKIFNKLLSDIGHPAPSALANIVSKTGALFDELTVPTIFEAEGINIAEFFIYEGMDVEDRSITKDYASIIEAALLKTGTSDVESVYQGFLNGFQTFIESKGYKLVDVVDFLFETFASELIVLHDM